MPRAPTRPRGRSDAGVRGRADAGVSDALRAIREAPPPPARELLRQRRRRAAARSRLAPDGHPRPRPGLRRAEATSGSRPRRKRLRLETGRDLSSQARTLDFVVSTPPGAVGAYLLAPDGHLWLVQESLVQDLSAASSRLVDRRLHAFRAATSRTRCSSSSTGAPASFVVRKAQGTTRVAPAETPDAPSPEATAWADRVWRLAPAGGAGAGRDAARGRPRRLPADRVLPRPEAAGLPRGRSRGERVVRPHRAHRRLGAASLRGARCVSRRSASRVGIALRASRCSGATRCPGACTGRTFQTASADPRPRSGTHALGSQARSVRDVRAWSCCPAHRPVLYLQAPATHKIGRPAGDASRRAGINGAPWNRAGRAGPSVAAGTRNVCVPSGPPSVCTSSPEAGPALHTPRLASLAGRQSPPPVEPENDDVGFSGGRGLSLSASSGRCAAAAGRTPTARARWGRGARSGGWRHEGWESGRGDGAPVDAAHCAGCSSGWTPRPDRSG